ncbi:MAG: UDP-N-acetylmuramoyl-L-alanine--D-glutamate ligase [Deltaproteobacteria bacterium]|nr:UDP-N-acetylmuramoyl-L-alanine--D-glutamate ligase [Deltaproteobacteria bacterium]
MKLKNNKILIVGLGKTGVSTAKFLKQKGAIVTATDSNKEQEQDNEVRSLIDLGVHLEIGYHKPESFEQADMIILSPGVPHTIAPVKKAKAKGISVIGEIEMASRFIKEPIVAVTGTNGKTTTTTLLGEMLTQSGFKVFVGGNIGNPLIDYAGSPEKADIIVAEISSFQLDTIETFRPKVGVLLNIAEDHMDRYKDFNDYARSKCRIFENQKSSDVAVFNGADPTTRSICRNIISKKLVFSNNGNLDSKKPGNNALISKTNILFTINNKKAESLEISSIKLPGSHNLENVAASGLAAFAAGGSFKGIQLAISSFKGLPHRFEYVTTINGVQYFNDSKATNAHAVEKALHAFNVPVVLIMGGRNKDVDFHMLENSIRTHVKKLIVFGEAEEEIRSTLGPITKTEIAASMDEAVAKAHASAEPGNAVLLSPACSSFDMYNNYAERGDNFREAVNGLKKG